MKHLFFSIAVLTSLAVPLAAQDIPLSKILIEKEGWREVAKGLPKVSLLEPEPAGTIGIYQETLKHRLGVNGKVEKAISKVLTLGGYGVKTSADRFYSLSLLRVYDSPTRVFGGPKETPLNLPGLTAPTCLTLWPDEGHLVIGEADGAYLWAVRLEKDGSFGPGDRYYSLRTRPNEKMHVTAMTMDAGYLLYACTPLGIQVFDPTGRLSGVIAAPAKEMMTAITIGGANADNLYVAAGERIFVRKIQGKAIYTLKK